MRQRNFKTSDITDNIVEKRYDDNKDHGKESYFRQMVNEMVERKDILRQRRYKIKKIGRKGV